jgi:hypothetical protein
MPPNAHRAFDLGTSPSAAVADLVLAGHPPAQKPCGSGSPYAVLTYIFHPSNRTRRDVRPVPPLYDSRMAAASTPGATTRPELPLGETIGAIELGVLFSTL